MGQFNEMITVVVVLLTFCIAGHLEGFSFNRVKRDTTNQTIQMIRTNIHTVGNLIFDYTVMKEATEHRKISCFFVFDKDASADLNNDLGLATEYATQLALSASNYTAMVNTVVINAGTEIWAYYDRISFDVGTDVSLAMMNILIQFQEYLGATQQTNFGTVYAVGVLISKKSFVQGGYSQGPPCTTSGASLINYRQIPYTIGGLVAHELAHTLSVVHPFELSYLCDSSTTTLDFCYPPNSIPHSCLCDNATYFPPQQCLMTFQFGAANIIAPKYTICDIKMMNYFSSNISCLIK